MTAPAVAQPVAAGASREDTMSKSKDKPRKPKKRTRKQEIRDERQRKLLDYDRQQRGGFDRGAP